MHHAWPTGCSMRREKFEEIGRKIAAKLKGDPGAAKLLGRQLSEKLDVSYWEEVAAKDWSGDNMKAKIWSYQQLPVDLQRCFTFCSLFRKGTMFPVQFLIDLWMAEVFIKPTNQEERMEDIGEKYMRELVSRFFLEQYENNKGKEIYLHDLFHDLAERVRGDDFITIDGTNSTKIPSDNKRIENIRHISLPASMINIVKDKISLMKSLCTLHVSNCSSIIIPNEILQEMLRKLEKLRVLFLPMCADDLPDSIGNLKHLRFLNMSGSRLIKKLPDSICKLYHLQTLDVASCELLPKDFSELISLRRFVTNQQSISHIIDIGRLTSLQSLSRFVVKKQHGHELHQLENLNQLQGEMCITGLENVANIEDAVKANMQKKKYLKGLEFEWDNNKRVIDDFQLLNALQPHPNISILKITGYGGNRVPSWLLQQNPLKHLTFLQLMQCTKVEEISFESLSNCKFLTLFWPKILKELPAFPPNLTNLKVAWIPQVTFCSEDDLLGKQEWNQSTLEALKQIMEWLKSGHIQLPKNLRLDIREFVVFAKERLKVAPEICIRNLQHENILEIERIDPLCDDYSKDQLLDAMFICMRWYLETMMYKNDELKLVLPYSLTVLWIASCSITSKALSTCIKSLVCLAKLNLSNIQTITSLPPKEVLCALKNLQSLTIEGCYLLYSLGGIGALTSLTELILKRCLNLSALNEALPSSLKNLEFVECVNVDIILAKSHLPVLRVLNVTGLTFQKGVLHVGHLSSLEELTVIGWHGRLKGLSSLASVHRLGVDPYPENYFPSPMDRYTAPLQLVHISNPLQLKMMLSDEAISSVEFLHIYFFGGDSFDDEVFHLFTSLRGLRIESCNITHLPVSLKKLASLQYLYLIDCQNLHELEDLPQNLSELEIKNCPTLMKKFMKGGPYRVLVKEQSIISVTF